MNYNRKVTKRKCFNKCIVRKCVTVCDKRDVINKYAVKYYTNFTRLKNYIPDNTKQNTKELKE